MIPFKIIELDRPRKVRFGMAAMVEFEETTKIKIQSIENEMSISVYMKLLWIMLKQEDENLTFKDTLKLVDEYADGVTSIIKIVSEVLTLSFNDGTGTIPNVKLPKKE